MLVLTLLPVLAGCGGSTTARPAGVAERWLQAVGDTGRPSVVDEAVAEAGAHGGLDPARPLLEGMRFETDASLFTDLEVGAAREEGDRARVPVRVTRRLDGGERDEVFASAVLERATETSWRVVEVVEPRPGELVPSQGGDRPASATARHWLAAIAIGAIAAVASALLIEAQPAVRAGAHPGYVPAAPQRPLTEENQQWRSTSS
jgi:hypothetical protein